MNDLILITADKVQNVLKEKGWETLNSLEGKVDASFNLFFLAIDHLVSLQKIIIKKGGKDYFVCMDNKYI